LGIDLKAARTSALHDLVTKAPAPIVAEMLGYSYQVTERHAQHAATNYHHYARRYLAGSGAPGRPRSGAGYGEAVARIVGQ
jgi:hypothetical protein